MSMNRSIVASITVFALLLHSAVMLAAARSGIAVNACASQSNGPAGNRFGEAEFFLKPPGESKARPVRGSLVFDDADKAIRFYSEAGLHLDVPYTAVTNLVYERTSKPRYALGLLIAWPLLFTKSKKHYFTIQYKAPGGAGETVLIHLDKDNYQLALATAEAHTGVRVERHDEH